MGFVRKVKGSLTKQDISEYIGEESYMFYDIDTGALRMWDGTPGGKAIGGHLAEFPTFGDFPTVGIANAMYLDASTNIAYRWDGSTYVSLKVPGIDSHLADLANPHSTSLDKLIDTNVSSPSNNDLLGYNDTSGKWESNTHLSNTSNPHSTSIANLTDTDISSPGDGYLLRYSESSDKWEAVEDGVVSGLVTGVVISETSTNSLKLSINGLDDTKVDIAPGKCMFVDSYSNPEDPVGITKELTETITFDPSLLGRRSTFIYLELVGDDLVPGEMETFDLSSTRNRVVIGRVFDIGGTGAHITNLVDLRLPVNGTSYTGRDCALAYGSFKSSGGILSVNATVTMRLDITEITSFRAFVLAGTELDNPNIVVDAAQVGVSTYAYHLQGDPTTHTSTVIRSDVYDLNGVETSIPVNKWVCQRIFYFPKSRTFHIVHGQRIYNDLNSTFQDIHRSVVLNEDILFGSELIGYIILAEGATDLGNITESVLINYQGK